MIGQGDNGKNTFIFHGKEMPLVFKDICEIAWNIPEYRESIERRETYTYRNIDYLGRYLKNTYKGNLPHDIYKITKALKYDRPMQDLFYMNEEGFKNVYPEYYASIFDDLSLEKKIEKFMRCDFGIRTPFELEQDVIAGNIYEDMLVYHSKNIFVPNGMASGRNTQDITTKCDLVFRCPNRERNGYVEANVEVKTKFLNEITDTVVIRGYLGNIIRSKGIILYSYINLNKAILIDMSVPHNVGNCMIGCKKGHQIEIDKNDFFDFRCWEEKDMLKLLHMIYDMRKDKV